VGSVAVGNKRSFIGAFVHSKWLAMNIRAGKYRHIQTKEKCKNYINISITFSREEFKNWCYKTKDYTLDNIQVIELADNIRKDKIKASNGYCRCYRCGETKPLEIFAKDKRRVNGKATVCRPCDNRRRNLNGKT
jgi:formylmethanofuran dehydrogenase subunit E